jgi:molybdate transport system substrate-binding protein
VRPLGLLVLASLALTSACGGAAADGGRTTVTVLAASSLTTAAGDVSAAYTAEHPDVRLRFSLAGSQELASQVRQGVPADVIVSADEPTMKGLGNAVRTPMVVATNQLTIVVAAGNPKGITGLEDLARSDVVTVLAAPAVPAGRYARTVLKAAGVEVTARSEEPDVKAVLTRVRLGDADAGIVYVTDVAAADDDVDGVEIPAGANVVARYPAAVIADTRHAAEATDFVEWLASSEGHAVLAKSGFAGP